MIGEGTSAVSVTVEVAAALRGCFRGQDCIVVAGESVREVLRSLEHDYLGARGKLLGEVGLRKFVSVYVNGQDIRALGELDTETSVGDRILIVASVAGG